MLRIIQKFYEYKPLTRIILVSLGVFLGSALIVGLGMYQYITALGQQMKDMDNQMPLGVFESRGLIKPTPAVADFFANAEALNEMGAVLSARANRGIIASMPAETREKVAAAIARMSHLDWDELLNFGFKSSHQEDYVSYGKLRERARLLASFTVALKTENPASDITPVFEVITRDAILMERTSPYLIAKMICIAVSKIMYRNIHEMELAGQISPTEAKGLSEILERFEKLQLSMSESMQLEFQFVEKSYYRLYSQAPFGSWLLDKIFGDPMEQYKALLVDLEMVDSEALRKKINESRHPLIWFVFPNFVKARVAYRQQKGWFAIIRQELGLKAGKTPSPGGKPMGVDPEIRDPYGSEPLKVKEQDGRRLFYCIGPNGKDDGMSGDDVYIK